MAVYDSLRHIDELAAAALRVLAQHCEGRFGVACVTRHQDALRLLDDGAATERALKAVVLGEALQRDLDRAL